MVVLKGKRETVFVLSHDVYYASNCGETGMAVVSFLKKLFVCFQKLTQMYNDA